MRSRRRRRMSYGTNRTFKSKEALREAVEAEGADNVTVFGTSIFGNETATTVEELADLGGSDVIVGPDVYNKRDWYANAVRGRDGKVKIK
jgi:hypothetical protein